MPIPWPQPWPLMKKVGCVRTVGGAGVPERPVAALPVRPSAATRTMAKARVGMPPGPRNGSRVADSPSASRNPLQPLSRLFARANTGFSSLESGHRGLPGSVSMPVQTDILQPRYRSPRRIATGGRGEIYRATDVALGRAVAVKVLSARYAQNEGIRGRFTREALAAARLSGEPYVITVFDVGEHAERPFIVMEYLGGGSLEERLRGGAQHAE